MLAKDIGDMLPCRDMNRHGWAIRSSTCHNIIHHHEVKERYVKNIYKTLTDYVSQGYDMVSFFKDMEDMVSWRGMERNGWTMKSRICHVHKLLETRVSYVYRQIKQYQNTYRLC